MGYMTLGYIDYRAGVPGPWDIDYRGLQDPRIYRLQGVTGPWDIDYRGLRDPRIDITGGYRTLGYIAYMGYRTLGYIDYRGLQDPRI